MKRGRVAGGSLALCLAAAHAAADDAPFQIREIASPDRAIQADLTDLDGDGRADLLWMSSRGLPPEEQRELRVHLAGSDDLRLYRATVCDPDRAKDYARFLRVR